MTRECLIAGTKRHTAHTFFVVSANFYGCTETVIVQQAQYLPPSDIKIRCASVEGLDYGPNSPFVGDSTSERATYMAE
jgi:hypothetical protein